MVNPQSEISTVDLKRSYLKLRDDLVFVPQKHRGETVYHIEANSGFYRVGYAEYLFISLLDGETSFSEAIAIGAQQLGQEALSTEQGLQTYLWLLENKLGSLNQSGAISPPATESSTNHSVPSLLNPFWMKLPLGCPDRFVRWLTRGVGWAFGPLATCLGSLLILAAICSAVLHWDRFTAASENVFAPSNWLWMALTWIGLKVVHELAHATASRYYGSEVREIGLVFILFAPMAYVDVTPSWRLTSKWKRIHIAAAGMYVELLVASIAVFTWLRTDSEAAAFLLYNLILMASVSTIAFNLNPLMRFDGYFILCDLLEIPNLYEKGTKYVHASMRFLFYGQSRREPRSIGKPAILIASYGWAASVWRLLICASLAVVAATLFHGAGVIVAMFGIVSWFGRPLSKTVRELFSLYQTNKTTFLRAIAIGSSLSIGSAAVLFALPTPARVSAPGIVELRDLATVRSVAPGFVEQVLVSDGEEVEQGDTLLRLHNDEISKAYHELQIKIKQSQIRHRIAMDDHEIANAQIESRNQQALEEQLVQARRRYEGMTVKAPRSGVVTRLALSHMRGTYVQEGEILLTIGDPRDTELVTYVSQDDFDSVVPYLQRTVHVCVGGSERVEGTLTRLDPRSSNKLPHTALSSTEGGPLAVMASESADSTNDFELVDGHFRGTVSISQANSQQLFAGQRGRAVIGWKRQGLAEAMYLGARNWLKNKIANSQAARK